MNDQLEIVMVPKTEFDLVKAEVAEVNRKFDELLEHLKNNEALRTETWYSTKDVISIYKVSNTTLQSYKKRGHIKYWQMGKNLRWAKSELDKHFSIKK